MLLMQKRCFSSLIHQYANKSQTPVGMRTLIESGRGKLLNVQNVDELKSFEKRKLVCQQIASFLRREMPIRFAHRVRDLSHVPYGLSEMPSIKEVKRWYEQSFEEVVSFSEALTGTEQGNEMFYKVLSGIYSRHQDTLVMIAKGLYEFQKSPQGQEILAGGKDLSDLKSIHEYFDRFFLSRIGIRILIGHYIEMHNDQEDDFVGLICMKTSPQEIALAAAEDATYMCERQYGIAPKVELLGRVDLTFPYIPSHLYYILFELLKNSMRAVVENGTDNGGGPDSCPPIRIVIADGVGNEDVVVRISDVGGGIPRSITNKVFSYLFTTARKGILEDENLENLHDFGKDNPMAGLGYGLPIARSYVRYFGGDLQLMSMHGYGTDSYVHLPRIAGDREPLV